MTATRWSDYQFALYRNAALMSLVLAADDVMRSGGQRVEIAHFTQDRKPLDNYIHSFSKLTQSQAQAFAQTYVTRERARSVLVEPFPPDAKNVNVTTGLTSPMQEADLNVNYSVDAVRSLGSPWRTPHEETLPSGLRVLILPRPGVPIASVALAVPGGRASGPKGAAELAEWLASPRDRRYGSPRGAS